MEFARPFRIPLPFLLRLRRRHDTTHPLSQCLSSKVGPPSIGQALEIPAQAYRDLRDGMGPLWLQALHPCGPQPADSISTCG